MFHRNHWKKNVINNLPKIRHPPHQETDTNFRLGETLPFWLSLRSSVGVRGWLVQPEIICMYVGLFGFDSKLSSQNRTQAILCHLIICLDTIASTF